MPCPPVQPASLLERIDRGVRSLRASEGRSEAYPSRWSLVTIGELAQRLHGLTMSAASNQRAAPMCE